MRWMWRDHENIPIFMDMRHIHGYLWSMSTMQHLPYFTRRRKLGLRESNRVSNLVTPSTPRICSECTSNGFARVTATLIARLNQFGRLYSGISGFLQTLDAVLTYMSSKSRDTRRLCKPSYRTLFLYKLGLSRTILQVWVRPPALDICWILD